MDFVLHDMYLNIDFCCARFQYREIIELLFFFFLHFKYFQDINNIYNNKL